MRMKCFWSLPALTALLFISCAENKLDAVPIGVDRIKQSINSAILSPSTVDTLYKWLDISFMESARAYDMESSLTSEEKREIKKTVVEAINQHKSVKVYLNEKGEICWIEPTNIKGMFLK